MSTSVLPTIAGLTFPATRMAQFATRKQVSISGKETRIADWSYPRYQWTLQFSVLRQGSFAGASYTEMAQLEGFFESLQGGFDSFLYTDPDDNTVTGQALGTGNGSKTVFPLTRTFGGTNAPVLAPNTVSAAYLNGASIPSAGLAAPAAPVLSSVAGGTLAATTYYGKATYVTASGETLPSSEQSLAVALDNLLSIASPAAATGATGWYPYVSTSTGTETRQVTTPIAVGTAWQEPTSGLIAGAALPVSNTTGWSVTPWGTSNANGPGQLIFGGAPSSGAAVTADFSYYFPCRFDDDKIDFEKFMGALYSLKALKFTSIK